MIDTPRTELARGKMCARCGCCRAVLAFDGEALCAACDDGAHPEGRIEPSPAPQLPALPRAPRYIPAPTPTAAQMVADTAISAPLPRKDVRAMPKRISPEIAEAIRNVDWSKETYREVAERLGVSDKNVCYYKRKFAASSPAPAKPKAAKKAAKSTARAVTIAPPPRPRLRAAPSAGRSRCLSRRSSSTPGGRRWAWI